jgi:uncharacterized membrane protein
MHKEWFLGQTDVFVLCIVTFSIWARLAGRRTLAGVLLGIACPVKPALAMLLPFLLWKREYRFAIVSAVTAVALYVAPFLLLPRQVWQDSFTVWRFWSNEFVAFVHNDSPAGVFARLFTTNPVVRPLHAAPLVATVLWVVVVALVVLACAAVIAARPLRRDVVSLLEAGWCSRRFFSSPPCRNGHTSSCSRCPSSVSRSGAFNGVAPARVCS